jgi:hypothetical protein
MSSGYLGIKILVEFLEVAIKMVDILPTVCLFTTEKTTTALISKTVAARRAASPKGAVLGAVIKLLVILRALYSMFLIIPRVLLKSKYLTRLSEQRDLLMTNNIFSSPANK